MKEAELRKHCDCSICGKKIMHAGLPLFWRVTVERFGVDTGAVRRQAGLAMMLGSPALASVMGSDEEMARPVMDPKVLTVCEVCVLKPWTIALALDA